jgi:hypothetical protein
MNLSTAWRLWRLTSEVSHMDTTALVNFGLSALICFLTGFAASYQLTGDLRIAAMAGGSAALAGLIQHARPSPLVPPRGSALKS